jgi:aromatic-L-amino-acid decarboxylase
VSNTTGKPTPPDDPLDALRKALEVPLPHPDAADMAAYAHQVLAWAVHDFAHRSEQPPGDTPSRRQLDELLGSPPPEEGAEFEEVLESFTRHVVPNVLRTDHPRFLAFVPAAPNFFSVLGEWLTAALNSFAGVWLEGAAAAEVELIVLDWFKRFIGYPRFARGVLTSGGTEANLTALVVARQALDPSERATAVLYASEQRHRSIDRAAFVIGLTPDQVRPVPCDDNLRLRPEALLDSIRRDRGAGLRPWAVVANAGATNTGVIDPLRELANLARAETLWLHADAAYGWPAVLVPEGRAALDGLAHADSITLDPHKWFAQTYESGCVLIRDGLRLHEAFAQRPDYLQDAQHNSHDEFHFADHGLSLTRRFRALKLWLSVQVLGVGWFRELVAHGLHAAEFARLLLERHGSFEFLCEPSLSVLCFRYVPPGRALGGEDLDRLNLAVAEKVRAGGRTFVATTRLRGRVALRLCFVNWRTIAADIEETVRLLAEAGEVTLQQLARPPRPARAPGRNGGG